MNTLERVARAICATHGRDPDFEIYGLKDWEVWKDHAQAAIDAMEQWQLIETAPEDVEVLVYRPDGIQKRDVMLRVDDYWYWYWYWQDGESPMLNPTHWLPLPEPPK